MSHAHEHDSLDPKSGDRRVSIAIWANALLTVGQVVGGILSGSLALIADALHNFSDMASLVIAFAARKIARRPADERMTFGYGRIEIVAALINYTSLTIIGLYLIYEGVMRIIDPPAVGGWTIVILGGVALVIAELKTPPDLFGAEWEREYPGAPPSQSVRRTRICSRGCGRRAHPHL